MRCSCPGSQDRPRRLRGYQAAWVRTVFCGLIVCVLKATNSTGEVLEDTAGVVDVRLQSKEHAELIRRGDPRVEVPGYDDRNVKGWAVRVSQQLLSEMPDQTQHALKLMEGQLKTVTQVVPAAALEKLRNVPIWISPQYPGFRPKAEYHPGAAWLKTQGRRSELVRCVEVTNVAIFEKECIRMPMLMLHELAHAYHHQVLGFENARVKAAYDQAKEQGIYKAVERHNGNVERAYAITNDREYFAESSEAFFGKNDFYPFNSRELEQHDPRIFKLLGELWAQE